MVNAPNGKRFNGKRARKGKRSRFDEVLTPKVFANSSPGLCFGNPGIKDLFKEFATLKVLHHLVNGNARRNPFRDGVQK